MGNSKAGKENGMIQFALKDTELREKIDDEVAKSPYKDKTKYYNGLSEEVVSMGSRLGGKSGIEEYRLCRDLAYSLPLEIISKVAEVQNRSRNQMVLQLVEEALVNYYHEQNGRHYIRSSIMKDSVSAQQPSS